MSSEILCLLCEREQNASLSGSLAERNKQMCAKYLAQRGHLLKWKCLLLPQDGSSLPPKSTLGKRDVISGQFPWFPLVGGSQNIIKLISNMLLSTAHFLPVTLGPGTHQVLPATHQLSTAVPNAMGATEKILQTTEGQWAISFNT